MTHDEHLARRAPGPSGSCRRAISPLETELDAGGDVHDVGGEVLGGDLEAHARPRRGLVEEDRHVATAQGRDLRDRSREDLLHRVGRPHDEVDLVRVRTSTSRRWRWRQATPEGWCGDAAANRWTPGGTGSRAARVIRRRPTRSTAAGTSRSISTPSSPSTSGQMDLHDLVARRGDVLADVVGADRQLAVAAIDEDREADRPGPSEVDRARPSPRGSSGRCRGRRPRGRPSAPFRSNGRSVPLTIGCWAMSERSSR